NALFVAEIGNDQPFARYFFSTLGYQGIGFAPFGMDNTDYVNYPLGTRELNDEAIEHFAQNYRLLAPMAREWAKLSCAGKVWRVAWRAEGQSGVLRAMSGAWQSRWTPGQALKKSGMPRRRGKSRKLRRKRMQQTTRSCWIWACGAQRSPTAVTCSGFIRRSVIILPRAAC